MTAMIEFHGKKNSHISSLHNLICLTLNTNFKLTIQSIKYLDVLICG